LQQRLGLEGVFREQLLAIAAQVDLAEHLTQHDARLASLTGIAIEALRYLVAVELGCARQEIRDALVCATLRELRLEVALLRLGAFDSRL